MLAGAAVTGTSSKLDAQRLGAHLGLSLEPLHVASPRGLGILQHGLWVPSMSILTAEFPDIQVEAARY